METAAADAFLFQMLQLMCNCFVLPQNEIVAVFYYFAMYRPVMLQVRNILKLGKAILLWTKIDCFITVSNYNNHDLFLYFYYPIFGKEIY